MNGNRTRKVQPAADVSGARGSRLPIGILDPANALKTLSSLASSRIVDVAHRRMTGMDWTIRKKLYLGFYRRGRVADRRCRSRPMGTDPRPIDSRASRQDVCADRGPGAPERISWQCESDAAELYDLRRRTDACESRGIAPGCRRHHGQSEGRGPGKSRPKRDFYALAGTGPTRASRCL